MLERRVKLMNSLNSVTLMTECFFRSYAYLLSSIYNLVTVSRAKSRFRESSCGIVCRILGNIGNANVMVMRFNLLAYKEKPTRNDTIEDCNVLLTTHTALHIFDRIL